MERIKEALEKAKKNQKQQENGSILAAEKNDEKNNQIKQAQSSEAARPKENLENLTYENTRVIKLNNAHLEANRIIAHNKNNIHTSAFDILRTQVIQKMTENGWRTLAITSPTPEAGKTVVAINLAMSIAQHTEKTAMLVDFDFRRPKIAGYLGLNIQTSLNDVIEDKAEIKDAMVNPDIKRFVVLPTAKPIMNSSEVLASIKIQDMIKDLRERYEERIVIFDLPPLLNVDDAQAVLPNVDCVLLVVGNGMSKKHEIENSYENLINNKLGIVLNKSSEINFEYYKY